MQDCLLCNIGCRQKGGVKTVRQPLRTAKFGEIGRRAVGGLKNDDLLIASKVRSNRFTDDKWRPRKFRLAAHLGSTFWVTKGGYIF